MNRSATPKMYIKPIIPKNDCSFQSVGSSKTKAFQNIKQLIMLFSKFLALSMFDRVSKVESSTFKGFIITKMWSNYLVMKLGT